MDSVVLETSLGDIQLELYWNHAPRVSFSQWYVLLLWLNWSRYFILDMSKLCWARKTRLLQWRRLSSNYRCESSSCKCVYKLRPIVLAGFHDSRWWSHRNRERWNEHLRSEVVRPSVVYFLPHALTGVCKARMKYIQNYALLVLGFSLWRTRGPIRTVRRELPIRRVGTNHLPR